MKKQKQTVFWAIVLDYEKDPREILTGLIFDFKKDALDEFKNRRLYRPTYKIVEVSIKIK